RRHCIGPVTSVCPSTTATAIPTFLTGRPPQQHGFSGWFTWFGELGCQLVVLPFRHRLGYTPIPESVLTPDVLSGCGPFGDLLGERCRTLMPETLAGSAFNRAFLGRAENVPFSGLDGLCDGLVAASTGGGRSYSYAYWPEFDALAHPNGVGSRVVARHLQLLDRAFLSLCQRLAGSDTLLLVTADHGFMDTVPGHIHRLEQHPELAETLLLPLSGEPRLAWCHVRPGRQRRFERYIADHFQGVVDLHPSSRLLDEGWFGLGEPDPRLRDRIGDYALLMQGDHCLTGRVPGEHPLEHIGVHGGVSSREMRVPLIMVAC
ncbi:MAG TPA: phosphodiesterase, partial [Sedimenticola sp.]|nr:phosphodiesterase [Sedimenticola sp.]